MYGTRGMLNISRVLFAYLEQCVSISIFSRVFSAYLESHKHYGMVVVRGGGGGGGAHCSTSVIHYCESVLTDLFSFKVLDIKDDILEIYIHELKIYSSIAPCDHTLKTFVQKGRYI